MRNTFNINFYCRASKANKTTGLSPLEMSIIINGNRQYIQLPAKFKAEDFNKKRQPEQIKQLVLEYQKRANDAIIDLLQHNLPVTTNTLKECLKNGGIKSFELCDLWDEYLSKIKKRVGVDMRDVVYRKYELTRDLMYAFFPRTKEICTLTTGQMDDFYTDLKYKFKLSTAAGYFIKVKTVFHYAQANGYIKTDLFQGIKIDKGGSVKEYLTESEIERIKNVYLYDNERLEKVRDLVLFQCATGLSYVDMANFSPELIEEKNGQYIYRNSRVKTNIDFTTVILPMGMEVLKKYDYKLPLMSNQKMNIYLKEIQTLAKIDKNLHTHLFRKTFATLMLNRHVNITTVQKMLGHSNPILTSKIYAHIQDDTILEEVREAYNY